MRVRGLGLSERLAGITVAPVDARNWCTRAASLQPPDSKLAGGTLIFKVALTISLHCELISFDTFCCPPVALNDDRAVWASRSHTISTKARFHVVDDFRRDRGRERSPASE